MTPEAYDDLRQAQQRHWWFLGRKSILKKLIACKLSLPPGARLLEVGCGFGGNLSMLAAFGDVFACDVHPAAVQTAAQQYGDRVCIGALPGHLPFAGKSFHLVALFDVLEHIDDDLAALRAVRERLAPGGTILITVPAYQSLWSAHDVRLHHRRRYNRTQILTLLLMAGYRPLFTSYFNTLLFPVAWLARRFGGARAGAKTPNSIVNTLLRAVFASEAGLLRFMRLPFGLSLVAIATAETQSGQTLTGYGQRTRP